MPTKKIKISKKTILIAAILIILLGVPSIYYLRIRNQEDTKAWYSSNWFYRKAIQVTGTGSTLLNEDVLIEINTSDLISNSKLQSDCDDLRFIDSDDTTSLTYWVEGGCNSSTTQVWVRIPNLPAGGKTIYLYYGNPSATNAQASWTGNFLLLSTTACPTGWTRESIYDAKFPYGSATYGTTNSGQHNHGQASCTTGNAIGGLYGSANDDSPNNEGFLAAHTHTNAKVDISNATIDPPYVGLYYCSKPSLEHFSDSIGIFNTNSTSLPTGFTYYSQLEGRYPKGNNGYIASGGSNTHTHSTVGGYNTDSTMLYQREDYSSSNTTASSHYHTTTNGTTTTGNNNIPYYTVTYGQVSSNTYATGGIIEMATDTPPLGWNRFTSLDNKYPLGASTAGTSYAGATHNHSVTINTGYESSTKTGIHSTTGTLYTLHHTHSCTTTSSSTQALAPYVSTIFIQRKTSQTVTPQTEEIYNHEPTAPTSLLAEETTNPISVTDLTPEFSAIFSDPDSTDTGTYYELEVNTSSDFTGTVMWDTGKTSISAITNGSRSTDITYNGNALTTDGATYYWRIRFWDQADSVSTWSSTANFTMNTSPTAPNSLLTEESTNPINVSDTTPEFSAICNDPDGNNCTQYQIQVNTTSSFDGTTMWDSNQQTLSPAVLNEQRSLDISYSGTTLTYDGSTYYWRIKFWDQYGTESPWSSTANFKMAVAPNAPTNLTVEGISNPTTLSSTKPTFSAIHTDPNENASIYYEIEVNTTSVFNGTTMWDTGKTSMTSTAHNSRCSEITYAGTPLSGSNNTYYWRIRFWDTDDLVSNWSTTGTFVDNLPHTYLEGIRLEGIQIN